MEPYALQYTWKKRFRVLTIPTGICSIVISCFSACLWQYNLFEPEIQFDFPKDSELVTFDTPFGKFGVFTCFDIFSYDPAVVVVKDTQVDSVLLPTAWYNTLPLLSAVPFHSAWARAMGVNVLAANTHNTSMHMTGNWPAILQVARALLGKTSPLIIKPNFSLVALWLTPLS